MAAPTSILSLVRCRDRRPRRSALRADVGIGPYRTLSKAPVIPRPVRTLVVGISWEYFEIATAPSVPRNDNRIEDFLVGEGFNPP